MSAEAQIRSDAAWLAKLARGSSWPGEMAQRVEDAADRVQLWADGWEPVAADPDFQAVEVFKALRAVRALIEVTVTLGSGDRAKAQGFDAIAELMGVRL